MAPSNDNQTDNNSENAKTLRLKRCDKHNVAYLEKEGCPECAKEKGQPAEKKVG